jgi:hypothetical protein
VLLITEMAVVTANRGWTHYTWEKRALRGKKWTATSESGNTKVALKRLYSDHFPFFTDKNLIGHVWTNQMWGRLHSIRVGPCQPMGRESGNNYKVRSRPVELSLSLVVSSTDATPCFWS